MSLFSIAKNVFKPVGPAADPDLSWKAGSEKNSSGPCILISKGSCVGLIFYDVAYSALSPAGMKVLRHEEFGKGCEVGQRHTWLLYAILGPYIWQIKQ